MTGRVDAITGKPSLAHRPLFSAAEASRLAGLFRVLANDTRLRLLHLLEREGEVSVGDLASGVGMAPQAVSNQLQRLADRRIVAARRDGNRVLYRLIDPCVPGLLDLGICLVEETSADGVAPAWRPAPPKRGRARR